MDESAPWRLVRAALEAGETRAIGLGGLAWRCGVPVEVVEAGLEALEERDVRLCWRRVHGAPAFYLIPSRAPPAARPTQLPLFAVPVSAGPVRPTGAEEDHLMSQNQVLYDEPIARRPEAKYVPCPPGSHVAVCVDVVNHGVVDTPFGAKPQVTLVWEVNETMDNGRRYTVSQRYTNSLDPKATLHKHLVSWRGRDFSAAEAAGFALAQVLGANAIVSVSHEPGKDGKTWARVGSVSALPKGVPRIAPSRDYVRRRDRPADGKTSAAAPALAPLPEEEPATLEPEATDEDIALPPADDEEPLPF